MKKNRISGQMDLFGLLGMDLTTDEKIIKYLFDSKTVFCGRWQYVKQAFERNEPLLPVIKEVFFDLGEWSNVIFKDKTDLDFSELDHKRVGVVYQPNGIKINYNGGYQEKEKWKYIKMSHEEVAEEVIKRLQN